MKVLKVQRICFSGAKKGPSSHITYEGKQILNLPYLENRFLQVPKLS